MKKIALILLFALLTYEITAQLSRDSLDKIFEQVGNGIHNFETNYALSKKALKDSKVKNDTLYIIKSYQKIGDLLWYQSIFSESEDFYFKSLSLADSSRFPSEHAYALYSIGWIECVQKEKINKLYLLKDALKIYQKLNDTSGIVSVYNAISGTFSSFAREHNKTNYIDSSIYYNKIAYAICYKNTNLKTQSCNLLSNLADEYFNKKDYQNSLFYVDKVLNITSLDYKKRVYVQALVTKAKIAYQQYNIRESIKLNLKNVELIHQINNDDLLKDAYYYLYLAYKKQSDIQNALQYLESYNELERKINKELFAAQYEERESNYKILKKEKEISELTKQNELFQLKENQRLYIIIAVVFILLLVITFLYRLTKKNKSINTLNANIIKQKELIEEKHQEINDSILYAKRIQDATLPSQQKINTFFEKNFVIYQPKDIISGDFYWFEKLDSATYFAAADCTGHGVPGAMVSLICSNALSKVLLEEKITDTGLILDRVREIVSNRFIESNEDVKDGMDISLVKIVGNKLQWSGANNPLWILKANEQKDFISMKPNKQTIGKTDSPSPYLAHEMILEKGDCIYIFTDGYADQFGGEKGKKFMYKQLIELIISNQDKDMKQQKENLIQVFNDWKGNNEQVDDVCLIGVQI